MLDIFYVNNVTLPPVNSTRNIKGFAALLSYYDELAKNPGGPRKDEWIISNFHAIVGSEDFTFLQSAIKTPTRHTPLYLYKNSDGHPVISVSRLTDKTLNRIPTRSTRNSLWNVGDSVANSVWVRRIDGAGQLVTDLIAIEPDGTFIFKKEDRILSAFGRDAQNNPGTGIYAKGGPYVDYSDLDSYEWSDSGYIYPGWD